MRGPDRNGSAPRTATSASWASVWPPRLDPPVPSTTTSVAPWRSRAAALPISSRSSVFSGRRSHGIDHGVALFGIVDAEFVELDLEKLAGDLARRVEGDRIGALEIGLGLVEFFLRWPLGGHTFRLLIDQRQGFSGAIAARGGAAAQDVCIVHPDQAGA